MRTSRSLRWGRSAALLLLASTAHVRPAAAQASPPPVAWSASVEGFGTLGNIDRFVGGARASARLPTTGPVQLDLRPSLFLGRVNGRTTERELRADALAYAAPGDAQTAPVHVFALALYSESRLRRIDRRWFVGAGVGWRPVQTDAARLALSVAPVHEWTSFEPAADGALTADRQRLRLSLRADGRARLSNALTVSAETFVKPGFSDVADVVWLTAATLDVAVAPRLALRLALDDIYESRTAPGVESRDLRLTVGLRLASR